MTWLPVFDGAGLLIVVAAVVALVVDAILRSPRDGDS